MTAHEFLDRLDTSGVVDPAITAALRRKVSQPGKNLSAKKVASYLVTKGHMTEQQAKAALKGEALAPVRELSEADLIVEDESESSGSGQRKRSKKKRANSSQDEANLLTLGDADIIEDDDEDVVDLMASPISEEEAGLEDFGNAGGSDLLGEQGDGISPKKTKPKKKDFSAFTGKRVVENQWDSKWIFIGPTAVAILALVAGFLYFLLSRGNATERYEAFDASYKGQRYAEAIERGDSFVKAFPSNEYANEVKVYTGMARIRIPVESQNWEDSLEKLRAVLPEIKEIEEFSDVRDDVPFLILSTAEGFATQAEAAAEADIEKAQALVDLADQTMEVADNSEYIPTSERTKPINESKILSINETISRTKRAIATENELVSALTAIDEAIAAGETDRAFEIRKALLAPYPQLENDPRLQDAVLRISANERELVAVQSNDLQPTADAVATPIVGTHIIATQTGRTIPTLDGEVYPLLINGTVYAVNAGTGQMLWRHYVDVATSYQPQWIDEELKEDLLLVNSGRREVMRVRASDGEVVWRTSLKQPFSEPVIANQRAYLATPSGELIEIDLADGTSTRGTQIPQSLGCGPATGLRSKVLYQPGLHSNLYVLSTSSLECQEVYYLGHSAGSIQVAPAVASGYLFVAENFPAGTATDPYTNVHVLLPQTDGLTVVQSPIRLQGNVVTPMLIYQRKLLVITDQGDIALLDVDVTSESRPVTAVAEFKLKTNRDLTDYYAAANGRLFVADQGLTGFEIQAQRGKLERKAAKNSGDIFVAPLAIFGDHLIHARIRRGSSLVSVSAVDVNEAKEVWRTDLAAPLAGTPMSDSNRGQVIAVNAQGDQFTYAMDELVGYSNKLPENRGSTARQDLVFTHLVPIDQETTLAVGPGQPVDRNGRETRLLQCLAIDTSKAQLSSRIFSHSMTYDRLAAPPTMFAGGVLLPSFDGQVFWLNPSSGSDRATPFQPAIEPGGVIRWCQPTALGEDRFAVADAKGTMYLVERQTGDQEMLSKIAEKSIEGTFVTRLTSTQNTIVVGAQSPNGQKLMSFSAGDLSSTQTVDLPGRIVSGPYQAADRILVILDDGKLYAFDQELKPQWDVAVGDEIFAGKPLVQGDELFLVMNRGTLMKLGLASGDQLQRWDIGEPVASTAVMANGTLVLGSQDGSLLVIEP